MISEGFRGKFLEFSVVKRENIEIDEKKWENFRKGENRYKKSNVCYVAYFPNQYGAGEEI